jgi:hypothetical protein
MKTDKSKRPNKPQPKRPTFDPDEQDDPNVETADFSLPDPFQLPDFVRRPVRLPTAV